MPVSTMLTVFTALGLAASVQGHSYLAMPAARNAIKKANGEETCPHCLQAGGPATVSDRANGVWPSNSIPESHGLCGDPVQGSAVEADWKNEKYLNPTAVQASYMAGDIAVFVVAISTHHMGHYEFRICDKVISGETLSSRQEGQDCLNEYVLERAEPDESCVPDDPNPDCQPMDPNHPGRWYLPPLGYGTHGSPADTEADFPYGVDEVHVMRYKIPTDLNCTKCTLQWYWSTGNACLYDEDYLTYFKDMQAAGWTTASQWCPWCTTNWATCDNSCCGRQRGFGEEFWNCADIAVFQNGSSPEVDDGDDVDPYPGDNASTTPATTTTTTLSVDQQCSGLWGQCGGQNWNGATCCVAGTSCVYSNDWYSQCVPPTTTTATTATTTTVGTTSTTAAASSSGADASTTPTTTTTTVSVSQQCSGTWGQCGGNNWNGATCCVAGTSCVYSNEWYSQCLPGTPTTAAATTTTTTTTTTAPTTTTTTTTIVTTTTTTVATTTTTVTTAASSCGTLCHRLNNTFAGQGCDHWSDSEERCVDSFISHGSTVIACRWITCGTGGSCVADGANLLECAQESLTCSCTSTGAWSNTKCRNLCHANPNSCSSDCVNNCGTGCECNSERRLSAFSVIV